MSKVSIPKLTILMPTYNCAEYLAQAMDSILTQSYTDFEFLIIDDGSTDGSAQLIKERAKRDPRIRYYYQQNMGLTRTLNKGFGMCQSQYVARQDADDYSLPDRLKLQVEFLDRNPDHALVGATFQALTPKGFDPIYPLPTEDAQISERLISTNSLAHGSVMLRREVFEQAGFYSDAPEHQYIEDYEAWSRLSRTHRVANLPEVLYVYRDNPAGISRKKAYAQYRNAYLQAQKNLEWYRSTGKAKKAQLSSLSRIYRKRDPILEPRQKDLFELLFHRAQTLRSEGEHFASLVRYAACIRLQPRSFFRKFTHRIRHLLKRIILGVISRVIKVFIPVGFGSVLAYGDDEIVSLKGRIFRRILRTGFFARRLENCQTKGDHQIWAMIEPEINLCGIRARQDKDGNWQIKLEQETLWRPLPSPSEISGWKGEIRVDAFDSRAEIIVPASDLKSYLAFRDIYPLPVADFLSRFRDDHESLSGNSSSAPSNSALILSKGARLNGLPVSSSELAAIPGAFDGCTLVIYSDPNVRYFRPELPSLAELLLQNPIIHGFSLFDAKGAELLPHVPFQLRDLIARLVIRHGNSNLRLVLSDVPWVATSDEPPSTLPESFTEIEILKLAKILHPWFEHTMWPELVSEKPISISYTQPAVASSRSPSFSVIIPFFRHLEFFKEAIRSLEATCAKYPRSQVEIVVVNDDPAVDTKTLSQFFSSPLREQVRFADHEPGAGITGALNHGITASRNEWLLFLDCDDVLVPRVFKRLHHYIRAFPYARYFSSNMFDIDEQGNIIRRRLRRAYNRDLLTIGHLAGHLKVVRRDAFVDYGLLDPAYNGCQDYEFVLRLGTHEKCLFIPDYLYGYRWHPKTQSVSAFHRQRLMTRKIVSRFKGRS